VSLTAATFTEFLSDKRVLIVDGSAGVRGAIVTALRELGARTQNISLTPHFEGAMADLERLQPQILICDYHLDEGSGLALVRRQHELVPEDARRLSVLVTGNSQESTIAEAAEEEVDTYILKPFTLALLKEYLVRAVAAKLRPSPYRRAIDAGKAFLAAETAAKAEAEFQRATQLSKKPSLAYYYLGKACSLLAKYEAAEVSYETGLLHDALHYRCLTGLFDLLLEHKKDRQAFDVSRRLIAVFPVSPKRLDEILRLAVRNRDFDDIDRCYAVFREIHPRPPALTRTMTAALVVAGIDRLDRARDVKKSLELFSLAIIISERSPTALREIVTSLANRGLHPEAERFLREFPPVSQRDPTYLAMEYLVLSGTATLSRTVEVGRKLVRDGISDPVIYQVLIRSSRKAGFADSAESLMHDAIKRWPDLKTRFEDALKGS
jgi:DNA-binding NarL/FixJ family response regulator